MKIKITNVTFADIERIAFKVQGVIEVTANSDILFTEFYCNVYFSNDYIDRYFKCSVEDIYFTDYLFPYTPEIKDKIRDTLLDNFSMLENNYSYAFSKLNGTSKKLIPARYEKKSDMIIAFINENLETRSIILPCRVLNEAMGENASVISYIYNMVTEREKLKSEILGNLMLLRKEPDYLHEKDTWKNGLNMAIDIIEKLI